VEALLSKPQTNAIFSNYSYDVKRKNHKKRYTSDESYDFLKYDGLKVSENDYWENYYELSDIVLEWNNGIMEEKPVSDFESFTIYYWFFGLLMQYLEVYNEGNLIGLEIGFKLVINNKSSIRKPDLALIHKNNPDQMKPFDRTYKGCFDICFEFLSDSNKKETERDTVVKKHEYENYGVKEYFIIDRKKKETKFYFLNSNGRYQETLPDSQGVIKSKVLKNFQFRLDDLYKKSKYKTLVDDDVYCKYILQEYQQERKKANQAIKNAEAERKRADNLEKELQRLKSLYQQSELLD